MLMQHRTVKYMTQHKYKENPQVWRCEKCGTTYEAVIPAVEVQCCNKHPYKTMKLIEGEPLQRKEKKR